MKTKLFWQSEHYSREVANEWCDTTNAQRQQRGLETLKFKVIFEKSNFQVYVEYEMI